MEEIRKPTILRTFTSPKTNLQGLAVSRPPFFLTAATMIGHVEKAAQGANFVGGPRPISLGENIAEHFKTDPEVTQTSNRLAARFVRVKIAVLENQRGAGGLPLIRSPPPFRRGLWKDSCLTKKSTCPWRRKSGKFG